MKRAWVLGLAGALMLSMSAFAADTPGADTYKSKCAMCHGPDGKGETPMGKSMKLRDLGGKEVQDQHDSDLKLIIEQGKGKMPAYKGKLTDKQIDDVLLFIRSLKAK